MVIANSDQSNAPLVSITIVNYNAGPWLRRSLATLAQQSYKPYEVIVVDNASADDSLERAGDLLPQKVVRNAKNLGFAAGQNQAIRLSRGKYVMPLNFDLELAPDYIERLVDVLEASANVGTVTGKLYQLRADGSRSTQLYSTGHLLPLDRFVVHRGAGEMDKGQYDNEREVFGAPAVAALHRRSMLDQVAVFGQYFDESLFTWYEDVDLDWRRQRLGYRCAYEPTAVAWHLGHTPEDPPKAFRMAMNIRNRWLVILANDDFRRSTVRPMLEYERKLFNYARGEKHLAAYGRAAFDFFRLAPRTLVKRFWTRHLVHPARKLP